MTAVIPRSEGYAVSTTPGAPTADATNPFGTAFDVKVRSFKRDVLVVDKFESSHEYIYDLDQDQSLVDLRAVFLTEAPAGLAEYLEGDITEKLWTGSPDANYVQFASTAAQGGANEFITVDQLDDIAVLMSQIKIPKNDRIVLASPKQSRKLASYSAVRDASQFGTNEAILNGEVARISGFRIVETPFLHPERVIIFQRDAIWKAILQTAAIESSREHSIKADLISIGVKYGHQVARDGNFIWCLAPAASGSKPATALSDLSGTGLAPAAASTGDAENTLGSPAS